ncbi:hypothetical protein F442_13226 [Phytophthora nicotianae P10297]|uniref:Glycosyl hydrolase family 30 TIM-barrel domain-containing protein n=1 Tax=Phytophthora nicotianae P10297 TaxID=1317064 RepID=W2YVZ3_PHYNI|nr:hypothetical protein F442_13226 [Phytophthora nicotianae P10297]
MLALYLLAIFSSLLGSQEILAACSNWSTRFKTNLEGVCVCNSTQCDTVSNNYTHLKAGEVGVYTTSKDGKRLTYTVSYIDSSPVNKPTYSIDVSTQYQTMLGFGGGLTDAVAINLYKLSSELQEMVLEQYFADSGLQYSMSRVPIGSTDFSTSTYTYNDMVDDFEMENFTIASDKAPHSNKLSMIHRALNKSVNGVKLFATSWAPPLWMTSGDSVIDCTMKGKPGGKYWQALALYYSKFLDAYKEEGIDFWAMSVQNEPQKPPLPLTPWQTLRMTAKEERDFIKLHLGPLMAENHPELKLMANDDQKTGIQSRSTPFDDPESRKYLSGLAFHWYQNLDFILPFAGNYNNLLKFSETNPDMFMLGTETCEGYLPSFIGTGRGPALDKPKKAWKRAENYGRDIIEDINNMAAGWVEWNMVLDTKGGPTWAKNYVDAAILIDEERGVEFYKQPMFYVMGHFAKFVPPGSKRIEFPKKKKLNKFHRCAFVTPNNQVVLQFLNRDSSEVTVSVKQTDLNTFTLTLPAHSLQTVILPASDSTEIM